VNEFAEFTSKLVGLGEAPTTGSAPAALPYYIVYTSPGDFYDGPPMTDANADPTWVFQFTAAAIGERQQLFMEDRIREFVLGKNPDTDGWLVDLDTGDWKVMGREFDSDGGGVIEGGVYSTAKRYRFQLTPPTS
jgi:hypothetical protein